MSSNEYVVKNTTYRKQVLHLSETGLRDILTTVRGRRNFIENFSVW